MESNQSPPRQGHKHLAPTRTTGRSQRRWADITTHATPVWCDGPMRNSQKCRCCQKEHALTALKQRRRPLFGDAASTREPLLFACPECDLLPGWLFQSQAVPPETPSV